jgi:hypothetical protein
MIFFYNEKSRINLEPNPRTIPSKGLKLVHLEFENDMSHYIAQNHWPKKSTILEIRLSPKPRMFNFLFFKPKPNDFFKKPRTSQH